MGGAIVFVASKNGLAASPNASAYCTAKASEIHLARCFALEGAEAGIRVNVVNPDAVLKGSKIWERVASSMPAPSSLTSRTTYCPGASAAPSGVLSLLLASRRSELVRTWMLPRGH